MRELTEDEGSDLLSDGERYADRGDDDGYVWCLMVLVPRRAATPCLVRIVALHAHT